MNKGLGKEKLKAAQDKKINIQFACFDFEDLHSDLAYLYDPIPLLPIYLPYLASIIYVTTDITVNLLLTPSRFGHLLGLGETFNLI